MIVKQIVKTNVQKKTVDGYFLLELQEQGKYNIHK